MKRTLAIASAAAIAGGVIAFSIASYATSGDTSAGPPSSDNVYAAALSTPAPGTPTGHRELLHGERVVKDKDGTIITVDVQRGTVTAVSESSMTVRSSDGTTWTWTLNSDTKVRGADLKKEAVSSIKVGNTVGVAGQRIADTRTARAIGDPPPNLSNLRQDLRQLRRDLRRLHGH
ncbi:MAG TPA: DUF5666 domain-containing protein [Jatrophihabitantaceae bacterium]|jgi:hypothetical protein|nr:DUF5666 domain-containing protein [Jatrophihabitantaceae bacterium]